MQVRWAGETTGAWYAVIHISGMLFTVLIGITGVAADGLLGQKWREVKRVIWFFIPMTCQSLTWIGLPVAIMLGASAPRDDVTKFMQQTGWHPLAASFIGLCLVALCAAVLMWAFRRGRARAVSRPSAYTINKPSV